MCVAQGRLSWWFLQPKIFGRGLTLGFLFVCLDFERVEEAPPVPVVIPEVRMECQSVLQAFSQLELISWYLLGEQRQMSFSFSFLLFSFLCCVFHFLQLVVIIHLRSTFFVSLTPGV